MPIFGHISLARDMKTALQEDDDDQGTVASTSTPGPSGAPAKKILSPEEKAKKLQREQKILAEVRSLGDLEARNG